MHTTGKHYWSRKTEEDIARKRGSEIWKVRFWTAKATVWQHESKGLTLRNINKSHPRRSIRASAPTDTSIRADRYEHPRRPLRASASVDADDKSREYEEEKRLGERGKERCVHPFLRSPPDQTRTQSVSICEYNLMFFLKKTLVKQEKHR